MNARLKYALWLAECGLWIAPVMPDSKLPYSGESWKKIRSRDPAVIRAWFESRPGMNYAVSPGAEFVILDLDTKKGKDGAGDLVEIEGQYTYFLTSLRRCNVASATAGRDARGPGKEERKRALNAPDTSRRRV